MTKLEQLERETLADLWVRVALDEKAHEDDRIEAKRKLTQPDDAAVGALLAELPVWKVAALRALIDDGDPFAARIREAMGVPAFDSDR